MYDFTQITEVQLARGSHKSASDGLCFMEMVAWFAGEKHSDKPNCACPILGEYGISLNDSMSASLRDQLLKPLVPLITGTRDQANEQRRAKFLVMWTINKILPIALRANGLEEEATACEKAQNLTEAHAAARYAAYAAAYAAAAAYADARYAAYCKIYQLAVEGLRQAILLGKHEGLLIDNLFHERREKLKELVAAAKLME